MNEFVSDYKIVSRRSGIVFYIVDRNDPQLGLMMTTSYETSEEEYILTPPPRTEELVESAQEELYEVMVAEKMLGSPNKRLSMIRVPLHVAGKFPDFLKSLLGKSIKSLGPIENDSLLSHAKVWDLDQVIIFFVSLEKLRENEHNILCPRTCYIFRHIDFLHRHRLLI